MSDSGICETIDDIFKDATGGHSISQPSITGESGQQHSGQLHSDPSNFYSVQVGIFPNEKSAEELIIKLKDKGFDPFIFQSVNSRNDTLYAVRIGKYADYAIAKNAASDVRTRMNIHAIPALYDSLEQLSAAYDSKTTVHSDPSEHRTDTFAHTESSGEKLSGDFSDDFTSSDVKPFLDRIQALEEMVSVLQEESEVRRQLEVTEEESSQEEEDILEAAGREYTLTKAGNLKFSYGFGYSYSQYDAIKESTRVEDVANHSISNSVSVSYGIKDNLTVGGGIPFVYKYHRVGGVDSQETSDLGDLNISWNFQPFKSNSDLPTILVNGSFNIPVGRSPYEIMVGEELSTSSGLYIANLGASISQVSDPVVVFSSMSLSYPFPLNDINQKRVEGILDEIDPGMGIGVGAGMGYALSYKLNFNISFGYSYSFETKYIYQNSQVGKSGRSASADLNIGIGYRVSRFQNLNFKLGMPITDTGSFSFSFSTPIEFTL